MNIKSGNNIIEQVVSKGFCVGCGTCAGVCPQTNLTMVFDDYGEFKPVEMGSCSEKCRICLDCCPRSVNNQNESTLAKAKFDSIQGRKYSVETGYFLSCYEGFSVENGYRENGASGGLATWLLERLLSKGDVDGVVCVRPTSDPYKLFEFFIARSVDELRSAQSSAYYPVELSGVLKTMMNENGRYAVVGLPCFLTALSLAERRIPGIKGKIAYKIGLVCGQLPNKQYIESYAKLLDIPVAAISEVKFRDKSTFPNRLKGVKITSIKEKIAIGNSIIEPVNIISGEAVHTACMFCDDVFAEVGDAVFMDVGLPAYHGEHYGTSLVVARNPDVVSIFKNAIEEGISTIVETTIDRVIASQRPRILNKRSKLKYRLDLAALWGIPFPVKRGHSVPKLNMLDKIKARSRFYRQQKSHGVKLQLKFSVPAAILVAIDNVVTSIKRRIRYVLKFRK